MTVSNTRFHRASFVIYLAIGMLVCLGCSESPVHPVHGKITLGGKAYQGLLVYMRPTDHAPSAGSIGIGQTDAEGSLNLKSSLGEGLDPGTYRVTFSFISAPLGNDQVVGSEDKQEGAVSPQSTERVPHPFCSSDESPVSFEVKRGENQFDFDIPLEVHPNN